jgi:hypothetical protein
VTSQHEHAEKTSQQLCVGIANFSDEPLTVPKSTVLDIAVEISESLVNKITPGESDTKLPKSHPRKEETRLYTANNCEEN